jgi:RNase H-like domain found in reverse transcriptase
LNWLNPAIKLCTICTRFGNDIAQEAMEDLLRQFEEADVYIDDIGVFSNEWSNHLASLSKILALLERNNFMINPLKCEWGIKETDWLGYWLTPTGLKPWKRKIQAILALQRPKTVTQLRSFIEAVTFYRDMFPQGSHILAPLTALVSGKGPLKWTAACQQAFEQMKAVMAKAAFIRYPFHNKPFHIYCDTSDLQLGAVIMQENAPVAFYSCKLNAQNNYTVGETELLSVVATLKEYRIMLYGCPNIYVYSDYTTATFPNMHT